MSWNTPPWLERFEFDRVDRVPFVLEFDSEQLDGPLDRMCEAITDELRVRRSLPKEHRSYKGSRKWLKVVCYNAILTCMYYDDVLDDELDVLDKLVGRQERVGRIGRGPTAERSIFDDALKGIFAHERPVAGKELLDRKDRERLAKEMWFGFRHYMEPSELITFNRNHPFHRDKKVSREILSPSLYRHIVKRRFAFSCRYTGCSEVEECRETYPRPLQACVDRLDERYWARRRRRR